MEQKKTPPTAEEWLIRSCSADFSDESRKELNDWLSASADNLASYRQLKVLWERSGGTLMDNPQEMEAAWQKFLLTVHPKVRQIAPRRFYFLRIAAAITLLAGLTATILWLMPDRMQTGGLISDYEPANSYIITPDGEKVILPAEQSEIRYDSLPGRHSDPGTIRAQSDADPALLELVVPRNRRITLVLSDGSRIWLNSESRLRYPEYFAGATRNVSLIGEGFFEVQKDAGKPFIVTTDKMNIEVLGTTFNVSAYANDGQVSATLVEGSVSVQETGSTESLLLKPNERAVYSIENKSITITPTDTELYTSWTRGYLKFASETLGEVMSKLVRSYGIGIIITDPSLESYRFSGKLGLQENLEQVLKVIQMTAPLKYHEENGTILIQTINE